MGEGLGTRVRVRARVNACARGRVFARVRMCGVGEGKVTRERGAMMHMREREGARCALRCGELYLFSEFAYGEGMR